MSDGLVSHLDFIDGLDTSEIVQRGRQLRAIMRAVPPELAMWWGLRRFFQQITGESPLIDERRPVCPICDTPQPHMNDLILHAMRVHGLMLEASA